MTPIETALDMAIKSARESRESPGTEFDGNMPTTLFIYRGNDLIASVAPEAGPNRDEMIRCAFLAAQGFGADILAVAFETYVTKLKCNPVTNRRWGPGEQSDVADNHHGREKGWVLDAIQVMAYNRAGDSDGTSMPYRIVDDTVQWLDNPFPEGGQWGGDVHDKLLEIMRSQTLPQFLGSLGITPEDDNVSPEEHQAALDITVAKVFSGRSKFAHLGPHVPMAHVALAATVGTRRAEMLAEADYEMHGGDQS